MQLGEIADADLIMIKFEGFRTRGYVPLSQLNVKFHFWFENCWWVISKLALLLIESEILVLWARSEMIGSAIGQVRSGFQVSGFRCQ